MIYNIDMKKFSFGITKDLIGKPRPEAHSNVQTRFVHRPWDA